MSLKSMGNAKQSKDNSYRNEIARLRRKKEKEEINKSKKYRKNLKEARNARPDIFVNLDACMGLLKTVSQFNNYYTFLNIDGEKIIIPIEEMLIKVSDGLGSVSRVEYLQSFPEFKKYLSKLSKETMSLKYLITTNKTPDGMYAFGKKRIDNLVGKYEREIQGSFVGG